MVSPKVVVSPGSGCHVWEKSITCLKLERSWVYKLLFLFFLSFMNKSQSFMDGFSFNKDLRYENISWHGRIVHLQRPGSRILTSGHFIDFTFSRFFLWDQSGCLTVCLYVLFFYIITDSPIILTSPSSQLSLREWRCFHGNNLVML